MSPGEGGSVERSRNPSFEALSHYRGLKETLGAWSGIPSGTFNNNERERYDAVGQLTFLEVVVILMQDVNALRETRAYLSREGLGSSIDVETARNAREELFFEVANRLAAENQ